MYIQKWLWPFVAEKTALLSLVGEWCHFASAADYESGDSGVKCII